MEYLYPILIFAALGIFAGVLLTVTSKVLAVDIDERIEKISEVLPQANCGVCGYAGCGSYASAIVENGEKTNLCKPGGAEVNESISNIMGTEALSFVPDIAYVRCGGDCNSTSKKYKFDGMQTCAAAKRFYSGGGTCSYGCIGLGDCVSVCPENAISIKDGIAIIERSKCIACEKCVAICPQAIISIKPITKYYSVDCSSKATGKETRQSCKKGCIACRMCEKKCPVDAIKVTDNLASIDYTKCTVCGKCYEVCPTGAITSCAAHLKGSSASS